MPTESEFLNSIIARPDDVALRLVYADWLDERSPPLAHLRAETIRVECEVRNLPVFADRFWDLNPRRAELRARRDPGWTAVMGYARCYIPSFGHGVPEGWRERWRLIRTFTEVWLGRPMPDVGGRRERVAEVERQLGRSLPPAVAEWVAFAADVAPPDGSPAPLFYLPGGYQIDIGRLPGHDGFSIARQDVPGGTCYQFIRDADAHHPDPPLTLIASSADEEASQQDYTVCAANTFGDRVTTFALRQALEWLQGEKAFYGHVPDPASEAFLARMRTEFSVHAHFFDLEVFEAPELLVTLKRTTYPGPGWSIHARVRRPSREVRKVVPAGFWEFITSTAKQEGRSLASHSDARAFRASFNRAGGRRALDRVVLVEQ
jgi:uncharacterized protein (TIGR02996 family)